MTEIARQGMWASLTGGWYYEPSNSMLCNTIHLYLWLVLFVLPLLLGMLAVNLFSSLVIMYFVFIFVLFFLVKMVVMYLHRIFDKTEPTVITKLKEPHKIQAEQKKNETRRHRLYEMIEMNRLNSSIEIDSEDQEITEEPQSTVERERRCSAPVGISHAASSPTVNETGRFGQVSVTADVHTLRGPSSSLTADRPESSGYQSNAFPSLVPPRSYGQTLERKLSEPILSSLGRGEDGGQDLLVTHSLCADLDRGSSRSLGEQKNPEWTDKSEKKEEVVKKEEKEELLPGTTAFTLEELYNIMKAKNEIRLKNAPIPIDSEDEAELDDEVEKTLWIAEQRENLERYNRIKAQIDEKIAKERRKMAEEEKQKEEEERRMEEDQPCCSKSIVNEERRPSATQSIDLKEELSKGDLTRFLEELVQRHPDALDAMENVRMRRMKEESRVGEKKRRESDEDDVIVEVEDDVEKGKATVHVASNYDDTSQGAMHSFQDEKGTWWSYTFDERGVGTARALGKSHQIKAMLDEKEEEGKGRYENDYDREERPERNEFTARIVPCPHGNHRHRPGNFHPDRILSIGGGGEGTSTTAMNSALRSALQSIPEGGSSDDEETVEERYERMVADPSLWMGGCPPTPPDWASGSLITHIDPVTHRITFDPGRLMPPGGRGTRHRNAWPSTPSNVLYVPPHEQRRSRPNRPALNLTRQSYVPSRLVAAIRATEEIRLRNVVEAHERREGRRRRRESEEATYRALSAEADRAIDRHARMQVAMDRMNAEMRQGGMERTTFIPRKMSTTKKKYYYDLNLIPFVKNSFKIKMDRLSLAALFDRNQSMATVLFDILLACVISFVCAGVLSTNIYHDVSMVAFAFVTASAHYSLMKSVQPDAASPTHGFNWQVSYSRPFYFLILSSLLLYVDNCIPDKDATDPWNWNLYRLSSTPWPSILLSIRDLLSLLVLLMPLICTLGWLPQVSTLLHHILEQAEMILLGGTASFGPLNALVQLSRTVVCISILVGVSLLAHYIDHSTFYALPMALLVQIAFLHSRMSSNPHLWSVLVSSLGPSSRRDSRSEGRGNKRREEGVPLRDEKGDANGDGGEEEEKEEERDERRKGKRTGVLSLMGSDDELFLGSLPSPIKRAAIQRVKRDLVFSFLLLIVTFALHCTTVLTAAQPYVTMVAMGCTFVIGICNHYVYIHLRKHTPWKLIARPLLRPREYGMFEADQPAALMHFEKIHMWMLIVEKNILYPLTVISCLTASSRSLFSFTPIIIPIIGFRLLRSAMAVPHQIYIPLGLSFIISFVDVHTYSSLPLPKNCTWLDLLPYIWYLLSVIYPKWEELSLKLHFVMAYMAPWQITWGSAFHAFAQPFSVPHTMIISVQTVVSSLLSAPLNPFLGSSFITTSYVRPVKFWEKDYNTERSDASNTRLAAQLEKGPMLDDSNLNAVFYEHLTRSLQNVIAGDILMGRWGASVEPGDCFILASFYLNCLVHIVEVGNGYVTFQLRGLEFRGTYCHQREVEAISEDVSEGAGCCCCSPGSLPGFLSLNTAWGLRWTAWEVTTHKYIVDGYSITDNSAISLLQVHELRRLLVTLYSKCIIYYTLSSPKLPKWMENETIIAMIDSIDKIPRYVDVDHLFCTSNDEDYDSDQGGISRQSFLKLYSPWIDHCIKRLTKYSQADDAVTIQRLTTLVYSLSLLGRRALGQASFNRHSSAAESFLYGLHSLFKGDFRISSQRDDWVFADVDLLQSVIAPSVRMALKLHQDHFTVSDDLDDARSLFYLIRRHQESLFISHEHDPAWRSAIMANVPSLLALRHMYDDGQDDYKIIMLNKMNLNMRVIKLNRECVRAFWSGQQQELVFLRNRNPERGSIQNARQVLRNMINSSADQPVGYPIYVSPLTTSFLETHPQYERIVGAPLTIQRVSSSLRSFFSGLSAHFGMNGSNSLSATSAALSHRLKGEAQGAAHAKESGEESPVQMEQSVVQLTGEGARVSIMKSAVVPPVEKEKEKGGEKEGENSQSHGDATLLEIISDEEVLRTLHEPMRSTGETLVVWPHEKWRLATVKARIQETESFVGQKGMVVFTWHPNHANRATRSHCGETIHLLMMMGSAHFVPVKEKGTRAIKDTPEMRMNLLRDFFEEQSNETRKKTFKGDEEKKEKGKKEENEKKEEEDKTEGEMSTPVKRHKRSQSSVGSKKDDDFPPSTSSAP